MSDEIGAGDPTEPHGIPPVAPEPTGPTSSPVDRTQQIPVTPAALPSPGSPPVSPSPPYTPSGPGGPRPIKGWVIGIIIVVVLVGLAAGVVWSYAGRALNPEPSPSSTSASPTPTPTRTSPTPTPTRTTPTPEPTPTPPELSAVPSVGPE